MANDPNDIAAFYADQMAKQGMTGEYNAIAEAEGRETNEPLVSLYEMRWRMDGKISVFDDDYGLFCGHVMMPFRAAHALASLWIWAEKEHEARNELEKMKSDRLLHALDAKINALGKRA